MASGFSLEAGDGTPLVREKRFDAVTGQREKDAPKLTFFRETPQDLLSHPPLASSLQNLETSFLLTALWRYPHALVSCASAIESALKAAFNSKRNDGLRKLLMQAQHHISPAERLAQRDLDEFCEKRNEIIHRGFSPKDDEISAVLLLKAGIPFVEQCYKVFFDFRLKQHGEQYGGLLPDLDRHLNISEKVYARAKEIDGINLTYCFLSFSHDIRWGINHWGL
jgi:hypothetical protein